MLKTYETCINWFFLGYFNVVTTTAIVDMLTFCSDFYRQYDTQSLTIFISHRNRALTFNLLGNITVVIFFPSQKHLIGWTIKKNTRKRRCKFFENLTK